MPSPYRETDNTPLAPLEELEWRRRVARSARWAELLALAGLLLLLAGRWLAARFALAWLVMGAALVVITWMYTAARQRSAVGWRGWLLRASVALGLGVTALPLLGGHLGDAGHVLGLLLLGGVIPYLSSFRKVRERWSSRQWVLFGASLLMLLKIIEYLESPPQPAWRILCFCVVMAAYAGASSLRRALLPVEVRWWLDNQAGAPGEWVPLLVYRAGPAEVVWNDRRPGWFQSRQRAMGWLSQRGYLPAERAVAERLVDRIPPDSLPRVKPRKSPRSRKDKQRVRDDEPRVRVAAEAEAVDGKADDIEERALDDAKPPRAVALHDPEDPRT